MYLYKEGQVPLKLRRESYTLSSFVCGYIALEAAVLGISLQASVVVIGIHVHNLYTTCTCIYMYMSTTCECMSMYM